MADVANSVIKSKFIARYGPMRAGFGVLQDSSAGANASKNNRFWTDIDGTKRPINTDGSLVLTTTRTLLPQESGSLVVFDSTTAFTVTLPAVADGLEFHFFVKQAAGATGHVIAVTGSTVKMYGKVSPTGAATAATNGKGRLNTQATSVVGDGMRVKCDGTNWFASPSGTWAEQP